MPTEVATMRRPSAHRGRTSRGCDLESSLGDDGICPGARCPFWDDGCVVAPLRSDLPTRPDLARHLLNVRNLVAECGLSATHAALPPGLRD